MTSINDLLARINEVDERLAALPREAFGERLTLREERKALTARLRVEGATLRDEKDDAAIRRRIAVLEHRIEEARGNRLSASAAAQTGRGGGIDPRFVHAMNAKLDEAAGVAELHKELQRLRVRLARLDPDDAPEA
ncbi:MAG: hypothetical protein ACE5GC_07485 [Acidimicrobiia bacterium]